MILQTQQNLMDMALQHSGDCKALFYLALANGISQTEDVTVGTAFVLPEVISPGIVKYFSDKSIAPAFEKPKATPLVGGHGIGYMRIGSDFKVA